MVNPDIALYTVLGFLVVFGIIIPIADRLPCLRKFVSLRWCLVVTFIAVLLGVIIDFSHITETVRLAVVVGVLIIGGLYIIFRSLEKMMANGWNLGITNIEVSKGDIKANLKMEECIPSPVRIKNRAPQTRATINDASTNGFIPSNEASSSGRIPINERSTIKKLFGATPTCTQLDDEDDNCNFDPFERICTNKERTERD